MIRRRLIGDPADVVPDAAPDTAPDERADVPADRPAGGMFVGGLGRSGRGRLLTLLLVVAVVAAVGIAFSRGSRDRVAGPQGAFPAPVAATPALARLPEVAGRAVVVGGLAVRAVGNRVDGVRVEDSSPYWTLVREHGPSVDDLARVDTHRVALLWADGRLDLVDLRAGRIRWSSTVDGVSEDAKDATPGSSGSLLAAGDDAAPVLVTVTASRLTALDPRDGHRLWARAGIRPVGGTAAGVVVVRPGSVQVLDARTGRLRWQRPLPRGDRVRVAAGDGRVALVTPDGTTLLSASEGRAAGSLGAVGTSVSPGRVAVTDRAVYTLGDGRLVRAAATGGPRLAAALAVPDDARLAVADDVVTVASPRRTWLLRAG